MTQDPAQTTASDASPPTLQHIAPAPAQDTEADDASAPTLVDVPIPPEKPEPQMTFTGIPIRFAWRTSDEAQPETSFGELLLWSLSAFAVIVLNITIGRVVGLPARESPVSDILAIGYLVALLYCLMRLARSAARLAVGTPFLLLAGVLLAVPVVVVLLLPFLKIAPSFALGILSLTATSLFLPPAAALVGAGIGRVIRHPNTLLAGAGFAIFFDFVVVTMGTVRQLMDKGSTIIAAASIGAGSPTLPSVMGSRMYRILSSVTIGPADVLFLALFFAAVYLLRLSGRATFAIMFGLLALALALVEMTAWPVPALMPMGAAVLIANARHAAFTKEEKVALLWGGLFALVCAVLMVVGARYFVTGAPKP